MQCLACFNAQLSNCGDGITVNGGFGVGPSYKWVITDKFGNKYSGTEIATIDGIFIADDAPGLPSGFFSPFAGDFLLNFFDDTGKPFTVGICQEYECINVHIQKNEPDIIETEIGNCPGVASVSCCGIDDVLAIAQLFTTDRTIDMNGRVFRINSSIDGATFSNKLTSSSTGDNTEIANFVTVGYIKSQDTPGTQYGVVAVDKTKVAFGQTEGAYQFQNLNIQSDESVYKPLAVDSLGNVVEMNSWPACCGIDSVLAVGQVLTATRTLDIQNNFLSIAGNEGGTMNWQITNNDLSFSQVSVAGGEIFLRSANNGSTISGAIEVHKDFILFNQTQGVYEFNNLVASSDFSTNKPVAANSSGDIVRMSSWPATGITTADNGLTLTGSNVQLGGALTHDTIISNITDTQTVNFKIAAGKTAAKPTIAFLDSTGAEWGRLSIFGDIAGNNGSMYFGYLSGSSMTSVTVRNNTAMGWGSMRFATTAAGNATFGTVSGYRITTAHECSFFGCSSAVNVTTGDNLSFFGDATGVDVTTAQFSDVFGAQATVPGKGTYNVSWGYASSYGASGLSTATGNLIAGAQAMGLSTYRDHNVVLGWNINFLGVGGKHILDNNILIGASINASNAGALTNTGVIGYAMTVDMNNVFAIARDDQNIILGKTNPTSDSGQKLQLYGSARIIGDSTYGNLVFDTVADPSNTANGKFWTDGTDFYTYQATVKKKFVLSDRSISTTAPLSGGGDLSANRTLSIADAVADGATKGAAAFLAADFNSVAGVISIDYTNAQAASGSLKGFLTSADWNTFNNKQAALTFSTGLTNAANTITDNLATGIAGGQTAKGGTASGESLTLQSTTHATKGKIYFGIAQTSYWDEANTLLNVSGAATVSGNVTFSSMTSGSVLFAGTSGLLSQANTNFNWDNTNGLLSITNKGAAGNVNKTVQIYNAGFYNMYMQGTAAAYQTSFYMDNDRGSFASYGGFLYGNSACAIGNLFGVTRADKLFMLADGANNLGFFIGTLSAQPLVFGTSNIERARFLSDGRFGIGVSSLATNGLLQVKAGNQSTHISKVGGSIVDHFADAGNTTTGETDLYSDSLTGAILNANGDTIRARYAGITVAHASNTRRIRVYFAGTVIMDTTAVTTTAAANWDIDVMIIRVDAATVRCVCHLNDNNTSNLRMSAYTSIGSLTLTNAQILKVTGQSSSATNDIVAKLSKTEFLSAA